MSIKKILSRLDGVRQTSRDRWIAKCPAHNDRTPSLNIGLGNGKNLVLIHCHAGCEPNAVLEAIGLTMSDLFDNSAVSHHKPPIQRQWSWSDVMPATLLPMLIVLQYANKLNSGTPLTKTELADLTVNIARVASTIALVDGKRVLTQAELNRYLQIAERLRDESKYERDAPTACGGVH